MDTGKALASVLSLSCFNYKFERAPANAHKMKVAKAKSNWRRYEITLTETDRMEKFNRRAKAGTCTQTPIFVLKNFAFFYFFSV